MSRPRYEAWKTVHGTWWVIDLKNRRKGKVVDQGMTEEAAKALAANLNGGQ